MFKNGVLFSENFDDFYFNSIDPIAESEFVFGASINEILKTKNEILVAELGFGVGRNFLNVAKKFHKSKKILHFVSIEKFPLEKKILRHIYKGWNFKFAKKLLKFYPKQNFGFFRLKISKNITLDLLFGEAIQMLKECDFKANAWFMDGFSPSKNEAMWSEEICKEIARLSAKNAILSTYTAAKSVQNALISSGFEILKLKGFGKKREMLRGIFKGQNLEIHNFYFERENGEFEIKKHQKVAIIGAGIAGISTAFVLQNLGYEVSIFEKCKKVATNGSGNFCGVLEPLITKKGVNLGLMHEYAFKMAVKFYKKYAPKKLAKFCGAKEFAYESEILNRFKSHENSDFFTLNESDLPYASAYIKEAGLLRPKKLCKFFAKNLDIKFNHEFLNFSPKNSGYELNFKGKKSKFCDILIFALGSESEMLFKAQNFSPFSEILNLNKAVQISSVRGQTTILKPFLQNQIPLSARGYICPKIKNKQLIGATFHRKDYEKKPRLNDDIANFKSICEFVKKPNIINSENFNSKMAEISQNISTRDFKILKSRVGFRSYSGDRFPIIGAFADEIWFRQNYKILPWQKNHAKNLPPKYLPNLYISTAHGARGLGTAILGAEILADLITNRAFCIPKSLINELSPNRFLIRELKKS